MSTIREKIKEKYNIDYPISGGDGSSQDEAIIINDEDFVAIEYSIVKHLLLLDKKFGDFMGQKTIKKDGKIFDVLIFSHRSDPSVVKDFYFDISSSRQ